MSTEAPALIILIHGTFANRTESTGDSWWQCESSFWRKLNARLSGTAQCASAAEVFHWSGANVETERQLASLKLAAFLEQFEQKRRPYHVIAHSHGGNVLLGALFQQKGRFQYLRSWCTVGTPFFRYSRSRYLMAAVTYSIPLYIIVVLTVIAARITDISQSSLMYISVLSIMSIGVWACSTAARNRMSVHASTAEDSRRTNYGRRFRWISLYSPDDEAISALTTACRTHRQYLPRSKSLELREELLGFYMPLRASAIVRRAFEMLNRASVLSLRASTSIYYNIYLPHHNRITLPFVEYQLSNVLRQVACGDDSLAACIVDVKAMPFDFEGHVPHLPAEISIELVRQANESMRQSPLIPQARGLLAMAALGGTVGPIVAIISDSDLVHTSYFRSEDVVELLAVHIETSSLRASKGANEELKKWVFEFYSATAQNEECSAAAATRAWGRDIGEAALILTWLIFAGWCVSSFFEHNVLVSIVSWAAILSLVLVAVCLLWKPRKR